MASATNINGFNIGGNNNSFDQRGHFYRAFLSGNVSGMLVKQNSTPNMTVLVEHGSALLNKNTISASIAEIKSDTSVTIDTANTSNPRIDTIVIYEDTSVAIPTVEANYWQDGAGGRFKIVSLPGTAGAAPTALTDANIQSAIGAGKPWARLANITVPANSSTIVNSNINNSVSSKLGVPLPAINGGSTAGVLTTNSSGVVSVVSAVAAYSTTGAVNVVIPTGYTTYNTITGVTSGKRVEITAMVSIQDANSGDKRSGRIRVQCDGVSLDDVEWQTYSSTGRVLCPYLTSHTPAAGNHTWTLQIKADVGAASSLKMSNVTVKEVV